MHLNSGTERPYVICHMIASMDGRIDGEYFKMPELKPVLAASHDIRAEYGCKAVLNGAVTAAEIYADGYLDAPNKTEKRFPREDHVEDAGLDRFAIAVDIEGRLKWSKNYVEWASQPKSHVIVVLTENVSDAYIAYLRDLRISYLFAGKERLDISLMLQKLKALFGIEKLLISGGGVLNWSFLQAGCMDELNLVLAPLTDGMTDTATIFDRSPYLTENIPTAFALKDVKRLPGDGVWLKYIPKRTN